jgi:hypothetical protein
VDAGFLLCLAERLSAFRFDPTGMAASACARTAAAYEKDACAASCCAGTVFSSSSEDDTSMLLQTIYSLGPPVISLEYSIRAISEKVLWSLVLILLASNKENERL